MAGTRALDGIQEGTFFYSKARLCSQGCGEGDTSTGMRDGVFEKL